MIMKNIFTDNRNLFNRNEKLNLCEFSKKKTLKN